MKPFILLKIISRSSVLSACALGVVITANFHAFGLLENLTKSEWASWVQAVGSVAALGVAFYVGSRQGRDAIKSIAFGYDHATRRRYETYSVIAQAAKAHCEKSLSVYPKDRFCTLNVGIAQLNKKRESLIDALDTVPIHDVGTYDAVESLVGLRISMGHLDAAIGRANAHLKGLGEMRPLWVEYDTGVIRMNCQTAIRQSIALMEALRGPVSYPAGDK